MSLTPGHVITASLSRHFRGEHSTKSGLYIKMELETNSEWRSLASKVTSCLALGTVSNNWNVGLTCYKISHIKMFQ